MKETLQKEEVKNGSFRNKKIYFTQVSNNALRDKTLSLKAKGLYCIIQSFITIEGFTLYKSMLENQCKDKETSFNSAWRELKEAGYLVQYKFKNCNTGKWIYQYDLLDIPNIPQGGKPTGGKPTGGKPTGGKPTGGKPTGGKPTGGKHRSYNNTDINNTINNNTNINNTTDDDLKKVFDYLEEKCIRLNGKDRSNVLEDLNVYDTETFIEAIDKTVSNNAFSYGYVRKILQSIKSKKDKKAAEDKKREEAWKEFLADE